MIDSAPSAEGLTWRGCCCATALDTRFYATISCWLRMARLSRCPQLLLTGDQEPEYVGLNRNPDRHHNGESDGPLYNQPQQVALLALQARGARTDGEVLRGDHLPQHAA